MGQLWNPQINQIPAWDSSLGQSAKEAKITDIHPFNHCPLGLPGGSDGKESICKAGDLGLIPGLGRSPGEGNTHFSILAWEIPRTEEPGGLQSTGSQKSWTQLSD